MATTQSMNVKKISKWGDKKVSPSPFFRLSFLLLIVAMYSNCLSQPVQSMADVADFVPFDWEAVTVPIRRSKELKRQDGLIQKNLKNKLERDCRRSLCETYAHSVSMIENKARQDSVINSFLKNCCKSNDLLAYLLSLLVVEGVEPNPGWTLYTFTVEMLTPLELVRPIVTFDQSVNIKQVDVLATVTSGLITEPAVLLLTFANSILNSSGAVIADDCLGWVTFEKQSDQTPDLEQQYSSSHNLEQFLSAGTTLYAHIGHTSLLPDILVEATFSIVTEAPSAISEPALLSRKQRNKMMHAKNGNVYGLTRKEAAHFSRLADDWDDDYVLLYDKVTNTIRDPTSNEIISRRVPVGPLVHDHDKYADFNLVLHDDNESESLANHGPSLSEMASSKNKHADQKAPSTIKSAEHVAVASKRVQDSAPPKTKPARNKKLTRQEKETISPEEMAARYVSFISEVFSNDNHSPQRRALCAALYGTMITDEAHLYVVGCNKMALDEVEALKSLKSDSVIPEVAAHHYNKKGTGNSILEAEDAVKRQRARKRDIKSKMSAEELAVHKEMVQRQLASVIRRLKSKFETNVVEFAVYVAIHTPKPVFVQRMAKELALDLTTPEHEWMPLELRVLQYYLDPTKSFEGLAEVAVEISTIPASGSDSYEHSLQKSRNRLMHALNGNVKPILTSEEVLNLPVDIDSGDHPVLPYLPYETMARPYLSGGARNNGNYSTRQSTSWAGSFLENDGDYISGATLPSPAHSHISLYVSSSNLLSGTQADLDCFTLQPQKRADQEYTMTDFASELDRMLEKIRPAGIRPSASTLLGNWLISDLFMVRSMLPNRMKGSMDFIIANCLLNYYSALALVDDASAWSAGCVAASDPVASALSDLVIPVAPCGSVAVGIAGLFTNVGTLVDPFLGVVVELFFYDSFEAVSDADKEFAWFAPDVITNLFNASFEPAIGIAAFVCLVSGFPKVMVSAKRSTDYIGLFGDVEYMPTWQRLVVPGNNRVHIVLSRRHYSPPATDGASARRNLQIVPTYGPNRPEGLVLPDIVINYMRQDDPQAVPLGAFICTWINQLSPRHWAQVLGTLLDYYCNTADVDHVNIQIAAMAPAFNRSFIQLILDDAGKTVYGSNPIVSRRPNALKMFDSDHDAIFPRQIPRSAIDIGATQPAYFNAITTSIIKPTNVSYGVNHFLRSHSYALTAQINLATYLASAFHLICVDNCYTYNSYININTRNVSLAAATRVRSVCMAKTNNGDQSNEDVEDMVHRNAMVMRTLLGFEVMPKQAYPFMRGITNSEYVVDTFIEANLATANYTQSVTSLVPETIMMTTLCWVPIDLAFAPESIRIAAKYLSPQRDKHDRVTLRFTSGGDDYWAAPYWNHTTTHSQTLTEHETLTWVDRFNFRLLQRSPTLDGTNIGLSTPADSTWFGVQYKVTTARFNMVNQFNEPPYNATAMFNTYIWPYYNLWGYFVIPTTPANNFSTYTSVQMQEVVVNFKTALPYNSIPFYPESTSVRFTAKPDQKIPPKYRRRKPDEGSVEKQDFSTQ